MGRSGAPSRKRGRSKTIPARSSSRGRRQRECKKCGKPAQSNAWCQGHCQRCATSLGYSPVGKKSSRRSPSIGPRICRNCTEPARREKWCEGHCKKCAGAKGLRATGQVRRRSPSLSLTAHIAGSSRRERCNEDNCTLRARVSYGSRRYCFGHAKWHRIFSRVHAALNKVGALPFRARNKYGKWLAQQRSIIRGTVGRTTKTLSVSQINLMKSIPLWDKSAREIKKQDGQCHEEVARMAAEDIDHADAEHRCYIIRRDQEILQKAIQEKGADHVGFISAASIFPISPPYNGSSIVLRGNLPGALGCTWPPVPCLRFKYERVSGISVQTLVQDSPGVATQHVAYHAFHSGGTPRPPLPWERPWSFAHVAELAPVQSIHMLEYSRAFPGRLLGQQAEYVCFLEDIGYIGRLWIPTVKAERCFTSWNSGHEITFSTTCWFDSKHSSDCRSHSHCVCGFSFEEAKAELRKSFRSRSWQLCLPASCDAPCICTYTFEEASPQLYPGRDIMCFTEPYLLHMAMAHGFRGQGQEQKRFMYTRARSFLFCIQLLTKLLPLAYEAVGHQREWDDYSFNRIIEFVDAQGWDCQLDQRATSTESKAFLQNIQSRVESMQAQMSEAIGETTCQLQEHAHRALRYKRYAEQWAELNEVD